MKILVVSLLRLGDLIQQEPLLRGLREKNPGAEIHLLINTQFATAESLFAGVVDRFFYFDREALQRGLGEANYNLLWSYTRLEGLVGELNAQMYNQVFNFTHNKLSAYVIGAIKAQEKRGLYQQDGRFQGLENRWLRFFNDRFSGTQRSLFHYVEILGNAFGVPTVRKAIEPRGKSKLVLFQCLTSDDKKNWGLTNFSQLKAAIEEALVDYEVCILGAPFEREKLAQVFGESDLLICGLSEAKEHLKRAALLVTGDTSIKHLAAQYGTPVVELALGSSDWTKTAAFSEGARILSGNTACAPCGHSMKCSQKSHLCAEAISVDQVFAAVWDQLSHGPQKQVLETRDLERAVWSIYLNNQTLEDENSFANCALELVKKFGAESVQSAQATFKQHSAQIQKMSQRIQQSLPTRASLQAKANLNTGDVADLIICAQDILHLKQDEFGYFQGFVEALTLRFAHPVQVLERVETALKEINELNKIRENLTRYMDVVSKGGVYYATGIGKLSISGFEEAGTSLQRNYEDADL